MDNVNKEVEALLRQILTSCGNLEFVLYGWITLSFRRNIDVSMDVVQAGKSIAYVRAYYSYDNPVCAIVHTASGKYILWWDFRESSTTYRGLYEFLNWHGIAKGKLNRRIIEDIKKSYKSFFVNQLKENKEKTND